VAIRTEAVALRKLLKLAEAADQARQCGLRSTASGAAQREGRARE
jgi:hypothetical protein